MEAQGNAMDISRHLRCSEARKANTLQGVLWVLRVTCQMRATIVIGDVRRARKLRLCIISGGKTRETLEPLGFTCLHTDHPLHYECARQV